MGFLNPTQDDDYRINAMPGTTDVPGPNAFEGALTAIPKGVVAGVDKVVQVANDAAATDVGGQLFGALTQQPAAFVQNLAREGQDIERSSAALKVVNEWAATGQDPRKTGTVGRIAAGTAEGITIGLTGAAVAGPWGAAGLLGAAEGYGSYKEGVAQGLDPETAKEQGVVTGMFSAAGALLPMKFGKTALTSIAGGAGSNVALGMMQRKLTSTVLEDNGYHAMAQQTRIADGESMAADAILGAAFGHYTHRANPADVDAAAAVATETHFNRSAPGVPTDPATATLHADTMEAGLRALADGDLPDIPPEHAQQLVDNVLPDPTHETAQPLHEAALEDLPGYADAIHEVPRVELPPEMPAPIRSDFGRVVDSKGEPMTVYHGTREMFQGAFDMARSKDAGAWFTPLKGATAMYGENVIPAHVMLKDPYEARVGESRHNAIEKAMDRGHDGVIVRDENGDISTLSVFDSKNIKRLDEPKPAGDSAQAEPPDIPLDPFHADALDHLVHNYGDAPYLTEDGREVTYRQMANEMQAQRNEADAFAKLHDIAAACAARNGA